MEVRESSLSHPLFVTLPLLLSPLFFKGLLCYLIILCRFNTLWSFLSSPPCLVASICIANSRFFYQSSLYFHYRHQIYNSALYYIMLYCLHYVLPCHIMRFIVNSSPNLSHRTPLGLDVCGWVGHCAVEGLRVDPCAAR